MQEFYWIQCLARVKPAHFNISILQALEPGDNAPMTERDDDIIDDGDMADGPTSGPFARGLWRDARWWLHQALTVFGTLEEIASEGLNRKLGRHLASWLFTIEATVRRLILAAALALGLGPIASTINRNRRGKAKLTPRDVGPRFLIFMRYRGRAKRFNVVRNEPGFGDNPYRHGGFARDPLLSLGAPEPTPDKARATRAHRRSVHAMRQRLSRYDPSYTTRSDWEDELTRRTRLALAHSRPKQKSHHLTPDERAQRSMIYIAADTCRAIALREATRLIQAPELARKLKALAKLMLDPAALITRTARRIAHERGRFALLTHVRQPTLPRRKNDRGPMLGQSMFDDACALWPPPAHDSS